MSISIHALLAESDRLKKDLFGAGKISIHALLAESDRAPQPPPGKSSIFLSTLSLRRATFVKIMNVSSGLNFYPRSPCGERQQAEALKVSALRISIHALLAESDRVRQRNKLQNSNFYPRSPCGERQ